MIPERQEGSTDEESSPNTDDDDTNNMDISGASKTNASQDSSAIVTPDDAVQLELQSISPATRQRNTAADDDESLIQATALMTPASEQFPSMPDLDDRLDNRPQSPRPRPMGGEAVAVDATTTSRLAASTGAIRKSTSPRASSSSSSKPSTSKMTATLGGFSLANDSHPLMDIGVAAAKNAAADRDNNDDDTDDSETLEFDRRVYNRTNRIRYVPEDDASKTAQQSPPKPKAATDDLYKQVLKKPQNIELGSPKSKTHSPPKNNNPNVAAAPAAPVAAPAPAPIDNAAKTTTPPKSSVGRLKAFFSPRQTDPVAETSLAIASPSSSSSSSSSAAASKSTAASKPALSKTVISTPKITVISADASVLSPEKYSIDPQAQSAIDPLDFNAEDFNSIADDEDDEDEYYDENGINILAVAEYEMLGIDNPKRHRRRAGGKSITLRTAGTGAITANKEEDAAGAVGGSAADGADDDDDGEDDVEPLRPGMFHDSRWDPSTPIDMRVIEPFQCVLSHGGYLGTHGKNTIIVISACNLPDRGRRDYNYVMRNLFFYVVRTIKQLAKDDYVLVYCHGSADKNSPTLKWIRKSYVMLDRKMRKQLCQLYIVHPTIWLRSMLQVARPFLSHKFWKKVHYIKCLDDLYQLLPRLQKAAIPTKVVQFDEKQ